MNINLFRCVNKMSTLILLIPQIFSSVIIAWNLSKFDEYTCWALLVALALYDLWAVLSPCGPLKQLVGLMQERQEPLPVSTFDLFFNVI